MVRVTRSTVIDAPPEAVWRVLRDFNSHRDWHPAIAESVIEGGRRGDQVGCVRRFRLRDGGELREQLLALSDLDRRLVYCILDAPLPLYGYVAQLRLKRITDTGGTFWEWQSDFETPEGREAELAGIVGGDIYEAGFEALRRRLTGPTTIPVSRPAAQTGPRAQNAAAPVRSSASDAGETIESGAMVLQRYGPAEALQWGSIRVPPPGSGEVRIRHTAVGLNYIDVYCRTGYFDLARPPTPLGLEAAGVVTAVGKDVQHLRVGQRVAYACIPVGAYTEQRTMDASLVVPLPDEIDDETAAAATLKGMTAEFLLHRVHRVTEGETVVVHAAAGGVGSLLCQWARQLGAAVIGTVGTEGKLQQARDNGCDIVAVHAHEDFVDRVMEFTDGRGADVVYDAIGRDTFLRSYESLAVRGHLVSYGQASGPLEPVDLGGFAAKSAHVSRPNYGHYAGDPETVGRISRRLYHAIARGQLRVNIGQRYPLREAAAAHAALEHRETVGATVLLP